MGLITKILSFLGGGAGEKLLELALEKTEDADKRNALVLEYYKQREETKRQELARVTIPWVDALHKMGRQMLLAFLLLGVVGAVIAGKVDDLLKVYDLVLLVTGIGGGYVAIKGRGQ